jgi:hypothetical protein
MDTIIRGDRQSMAKLLEPRMARPVRTRSATATQVNTLSALHVCHTLYPALHIFVNRDPE